jgi:hypothetical protein
MEIIFEQRKIPSGIFFQKMFLIRRLTLILVMASTLSLLAKGTYSQNTKITASQSAPQPGKIVTGKVTDSAGSPIPGVTILIEGTTNGTITDGNGKYTISNVTETSTLKYSFVGMKTQLAVIGKKTSLNVVLEDANIKLSSVLTNVDGAVDSNIIDDLIAGKTNINGLMQHYQSHIKASKEEFRKALQGRLIKLHPFMLRVIKESITDKESLIDKIEKQIDELAKQYAFEIELLQLTMLSKTKKSIKNQFCTTIPKEELNRISTNRCHKTQ